MSVPRCKHFLPRS